MSLMLHKSCFVASIVQNYGESLGHKGFTNSVYFVLGSKGLHIEKRVQIQRIQESHLVTI